MLKILKVVLVFFLLSFSCYMPIRVPDMAPAQSGVIWIEAFRFYNGKIFVIKSEIIPEQFYYETATRIPRRKRMWLEIYIAERNKIVLYKTMIAKKIPAKPEAWEFEDFTGEMK